MDYSPPASSVHGISQAGILEWVAISSSRRSSQPRDWTQASCTSCIGRWLLYHWATCEAPSQSRLARSSLHWQILWKTPVTRSVLLPPSPCLPVHTADTWSLQDGGTAVPPRAWQERGRGGRGAAQSAHKTLALLPHCVSVPQTSGKDHALK